MSQTSANGLRLRLPVKRMFDHSYTEVCVTRVVTSVTTSEARICVPLLLFSRLLVVRANGRDDKKRLSYDSSNLGSRTKRTQISLQIHSHQHDQMQAAQRRFSGAV
jgi:hypothetical protein